ncbi:MAG: hypothetical protein IT463_05375 [Planctomycetes bacterium]|nr:hypothetical protein [Planctomycetota bacterium]
MPRFRRFLLPALAAALLLPAVVVQAGDPPKPAPKADPKPRVLKPEEITAAEALVSKLDGEQQMAANGLRYLLCPAWEPEMMQGLLYDPCPLPPLGEPRTRSLHIGESLRLWALVAVGMPATDALKRELDQFIKSQHKRREDSLAAYAVPLAVCRAALRRPDLQRTKELKEKAKDLMELGMKVRDLTGETSPCIKGMVIEPMWFANHLWRAVMFRCALELNLKSNIIVWEAELKNLAHAAHKELGWISTQGSGLTAENDLNSNLLALAAIGLAMGTPDRTVDKSVFNSLQKRLENLPLVLTRLTTTYSAEPMVGARLALVRTLFPDWAPEKLTGADWRHDLRSRAVAAMLASGAVQTKHSLTHDLGLDGLLLPRAARTAAETALSCLSVCGGLFGQEDPPLQGMSPEEFEKLMRALSALHASVAPATPRNAVLNMRTEEAILSGAAWLEKQQAPDGSFGSHGKLPAGGYRGSPAYCAAALHAMMHGGYKPEHRAIQAGVQWLAANVPGALKGVVGNTTHMTSYDAGIILMMLQKFYEPLQEEHGVFVSTNQKSAQAARAKVWKDIKSNHRDLIQGLVSYLDRCYVGGSQGGWAYGPIVIADGPKGKEILSHSDNSISQFAGCGYKCASMLGANVNTSVFKNEVDTLLAQYVPAPKSAPVKFERYPPLEPPQPQTGDERYLKGAIYEPKVWEGSIQPGGWGYYRAKSGTNARPSGIQYNGTGMALLAGARDELWAHNNLPTDLHRKIDLHLFGAQCWMASHAYWKQELPEESELAKDDEKLGENAVGGSGWGSIYNFYAIERGCVMAGYELLAGKVEWYRHVAIQLVDSQRNGSWGGTLETAWAILILRRAAPPNVTCPRPPKDPGKAPVVPGTKRFEEPKARITPGPVKREAPKPEPPKEKPPVTGH